MTPSEARERLANRTPDSIDYAEMCDLFAALYDRDPDENDGDVWTAIRLAARLCTCTPKCSTPIPQESIDWEIAHGLPGHVAYASPTHRRRADKRRQRLREAEKKSQQTA